MSKQSEHIKLENRTAEEYRQVADAHAQELKGFWKRFAVSGLFVIAVVVIILASLAWFASNRSVDASTSAISAKAGRFSIEGVANGENAQVGYYERSSTDSSAKPKDLQTNDSMKVSTTFNLNNYDGGSLRPGSSGELQITVTPVAKNVGDINITLERIVEMRSSVTDTGSTSEADSSTDADAASTSGTTDDGKVIPTQTQLEDLFRGHIVFFRAKDSGYYSNPVLDDKLTIQSSEFCKKDENGSPESTETTEPVTITLHWVWPSQFSSFVLTGQINYNPNLFESTTSTGYRGLLSAINDSRNAASGTAAQYYLDEDWGTSGVSALPAVESGMAAANLQTCSASYNYADEALGTCAAFLQVRFTAEEAS